jgi:hypothetical protein
VPEKQQLDLESSDEDNYRLHVTTELIEDANLRRQIALDDARSKRWKESCIFVFALTAIVLIFLGCKSLFVYGAPEDKKWATATLSAITSGIIGFLVGKQRP